jgi:hypothetical protein
LFANVDGGGPAQIVNQQVNLVDKKDGKGGVNGIDGIGEQRNVSELRKPRRQFGEAQVYDE